MDLDTARYWLEKVVEAQSTVTIEQPEVVKAIKTLLERNEELESALSKADSGLSEARKAIGRAL
jgi:hypothetical protein